jgi:hypothetical protein
MKNRLLPFLLFSLISFGLHAQWVQRAGCDNPLSFTQSGTTLYAGDGPVYSGGGGVYASTDNGVNWNITGQTVGNIYAMATIGNTVFAAMFGSGVKYTNNGGTSWTYGCSGLNNGNIYAMATIGPDLFVGTDAGVFLSTDNGLTCSKANTGLTNLYVRAFAVSGTTLYAGTGGGGVFVSTDNGGTWTALNNGLTNLTVYALAVNGTNLFAGTQGGTGGVYFSSNSGATWSPASTGLGTNSITALALSGNSVFAGTSGNYVFASSDNGGSWTGIGSGLIPYSTHALMVSGTMLVGGFNNIPSSGIWTRDLSEITGIRDRLMDNTFAVWPNPFCNQTHIQFSEEQQNSLLTVLSLTGNVVLQTLVNGNQVEIDMSGISKGIYLVQLSDKSKSIYHTKIVLQ